MNAKRLLFSNCFEFVEGARRAARCSFVYRITSDGRFKDRALAYLELLLQEGKWANSPKDCHFGLETAAFCQNIAEVYDQLFEEIPAATRERFVGGCRKELIDVFLNDCRNGRNPHLGGARTMNHVGVQAGGACSLMLALHGDTLDLSKEIEIARSHLLRFFEWYDDAGCSLELGAYWVYANFHALRCAASLARNGWPNLFKQRAKKLERYAYPLLAMSIGGKCVASFGDNYYGVFQTGDATDVDLNRKAREITLPPDVDARLVHQYLRASILLLACEFQDPILQWFAGHFTHGGEWAILFGDESLSETPPDRLPTTMTFHGCGVGILRSSMTDPETLFLGLKAGRARGKDYDDPHCQFDLNSVVLDAYGKSLLADPGYRHVWGTSMSTLDPNHIANSTPVHNSLQVDGQGQHVEDNPLAHLQDLSPNEEIDYIVSRIERGYGDMVKTFDRHTYLLNKQLFVLIDDIHLAEPKPLTWNFHGIEAARIAAEPAPEICAGGVRLSIDPFIDDSTETLSVITAHDHVLPRLQFDLKKPVKSIRVGWLLQTNKEALNPAEVTASFTSGGARVMIDKQVYDLPVVGRRSSFVSDTLMVFPRT